MTQQGESRQHTIGQHRRLVSGPSRSTSRVRLVPRGEIRSFEVTEDELDKIASLYASVWWTLVAACFTACVSLLSTTLAASSQSPTYYAVMTSLIGVLFLAGIASLIPAVRTTRDHGKVVRGIKERDEN